MNKYLKSFLRRGLIFGGFGPIIMGIVYFILSESIADFSLNGGQVFVATVSVYLLAFIQAGASVFNQIEHWSPLRSLSVHITVIYLAYLSCYLVNSWLHFDWTVMLIFTAIFVISYLVIWFTVFICVRISSKRLNTKLSAPAEEKNSTDHTPA